MSARGSMNPCAAHLAGGFSLIEVLFAMAILAIGLIAVLQMFTTGIQVGNESRNTVNAALTAQSMATRLLAEVDTAMPPRPVFLDRIATGQEWVHNASGLPEPQLVAAGSEFYWSCRASRKPMAPGDLTQDTTDPDHAPGLYQVAIFVYRNYRAGKQPISSYTTMVTAGY